MPHDILPPPSPISACKQCRNKYPWLRSKRSCILAGAIAKALLATVASWSRRAADQPLASMAMVAAVGCLQAFMLLVSVRNVLIPKQSANLSPGGPTDTEIKRVKHIVGWINVIDMMVMLPLLIIQIIDIGSYTRVALSTLLALGDLFICALYLFWHTGWQPHTHVQSNDPVDKLLISAIDKEITKCDVENGPGPHQGVMNYALPSRSNRAERAESGVLQPQRDGHSTTLLSMSRARSPKHSRNHSWSSNSSSSAGPLLGPSRQETASTFSSPSLASSIASAQPSQFNLDSGLMLSSPGSAGDFSSRYSRGRADYDVPRLRIHLDESVSDEEKSRRAESFMLPGSVQNDQIDRSPRPRPENACSTISVPA